MNAEVEERLERAGKISDENERLKAIVDVLSPVYLTIRCRLPQHKRKSIARAQSRKRGTTWCARRLTVSILRCSRHQEPRADGARNV